jgi:hypothetical protein
MRTTTCTGPTCDASVIWAKTVNDRKMVLDARPVDPHHYKRGLFRVEDHTDGPRCFYVSQQDAILYNTTVYVAHWGSCPDRDHFRRRTTRT